MDINYILSFKNHIDVQNFSLNIEELNNSSSNIIKNYKNEKYNTKKNSLKNDITINNKINLILNKLSEINFNNIIIEFIENINFITNEEYEEFQKLIYIKILSDINFINLYLKFLELINYTYNNVLKYNLDYLINLIDLKFKLDYLNENINNEKYNFLNTIDIYNNRINNIILIKNLYDYELISNESYEYYENILFDNSQSNNVSDIYYWKPIINEISIQKIKNILNKNINIRDKILLENLLNNNKTEINYIIDEYNKNNIDKIIEYINISGCCIDSISKTKLCKNIIEKHLENNTNNDLLNLINLLIDNKILNKIDLHNCFKLIKNNNINNIINFFK